MSKDALSTLLEMREDPYAYARAWKERTGGRVVGFFCSCAPEEIIHAAGALPVRITGRNRAVSKSGAHLQSYCCSLARTGLDMALDGTLGFLDGTVFTHTCDTMMRLSDIWRLNAGFEFHADAVLPVRYEGEAAADYMYAELDAFRNRVGEHLAEVGNDELQVSIATYNRNRELLSELYRLRRQDPGLLACDRALWVVTAGSLMDRAEHSALLEEIIDDLGARAGGGGDEKVPLFGVGSLMDQWEFLRMVEDAGATIIDDDFCNGRRYFDTPVPDDADPITAIARRLTDRALCPCKHRPSGSRAADIAGRVEAAGASGVVFFLFKFCEPHGFDYPFIKKALDDSGIPSLLLEIEQGSVSAEQLRTRVEALLETIRGV